jgi:hypothetical protein
LNLFRTLAETKKPQVAAIEKPPSLAALESPISEHSEPENSLKRKRAPPPVPATKAYVTPYPQSESQPRRNSYSYSHNTIATPAAAPASTPVQNVVRPPLLNYVYQKQNPPNGTKRHQLLHRAQRDSQEPTTQANSFNGYGGVITGAGYSSASLSPSTQLNQAPTPPQYFQEQKSGKIASEPRDTETSLIDTLSRRKQKQIFSIIGGLQSGIRSVRQQTEDLQKQLNLLQEALGIGVDDDDDSLIV